MDSTVSNLKPSVKVSHTWYVQGNEKRCCPKSSHITPEYQPTSPRTPTVMVTKEEQEEIHDTTSNPAIRRRSPQNRALRFLDEPCSIPFKSIISAKRCPTSSPVLRHRSNLGLKSLNSCSTTCRLNAAWSSVASWQAFVFVLIWRRRESSRPK
jgi:hypothetical protein